jgi:hypothetical protein
MQTNVTDRISVSTPLGANIRYQQDKPRLKMELWLTQVWLVTSGLIGLFLDPKNRKAWWAKPMLVAFILVPAGLAISFGQQKAESARQQALRAEEQHRKDQQEIAALQKRLGLVGDDVKTLLLGFGFTSKTAANATSDQVAISKTANALVSTAVEASDASTKAERQRITVQYFPKNVDPIVIRNTLSSLGFTFSEGIPQLQGATNAIWFGKDVPLSDVKLVALTLVRAGVEVKSIKPFRRSHPASDRNLLIQVGTDEQYIGMPTMSVSDITSATAFTRPD